MQNAIAMTDGVLARDALERKEEWAFPAAAVRRRLWSSPEFRERCREAVVFAVLDLPVAAVLAQPAVPRHTLEGSRLPTHQRPRHTATCRSPRVATQQEPSRQVLLGDSFGSYDGYCVHSESLMRFAVNLAATPLPGA